MAANWRAPDRPELGMVNRISSLLRSTELARPGCMPDLRSGSSLLIGSDYSGQHKSSEYEAMSFLIADWSRSLRWNALQKTLRGSRTPDDRRFGFKHMGDGIRRAALPHFLEAADSLTGLLLVVLVHKSVGPLFSENVDVVGLDEKLQPMSTWQAPALERAMGASIFVSLLLSGLSRQHQDVLWITDADDIVANEARHRQLVQLFGAVSGRILSHDLGRMQIATTASDNGNRGVEDFVAIPDLAAGTICDALNVCSAAQLIPMNGVISPIPESLRPTTRLLMTWWANATSPLKRVAVSIERGSADNKVLLSLMDFPAMTKPWV